MTTTFLIAAGFLPVIVVGFLCYIVIAAERDSDPWN